MKISPSPLKMSTSQDRVESDDVSVPPSQWKSIWQENKGMILILISEVAGSSMDAIARFTQQGEQGMHPFQVR